MELVFFHGWALDHHFWTPLAKHLGLRTHFFDRGYFGEPQMPELPQGPFLIITHSYGLHQVPTHWFEQAAGLVIIGGFLEFHPKGPLEKASRRGLKQMRAGLKEDPASTLEQFYLGAASLGHPPYPVKTDYAVDLLETDLQALDTCCLDPASLAGVGRILIAQGEADQVVLPAKAEELAQALPQAQRVMYAQSEHDLGHFQAAPLGQDIQERLL